LSISARELGKWGEKMAADFLVGQGYGILARNVRTPYGEIDLVAQQLSKHPQGGQTIVFVEVKTRSSRTFGYPETSVTPKKQEHLISAAQYYLQEHPDLHQDWRVDVIAIQRYKDREPMIQHFENAVHE
jgi:putative endonuclease